MRPSPKLILGVDTGGTFTDFVLLNCATNKVRIHKVLSTPQTPEQAIVRGIEELGLTPEVASGKLIIIHGSTVATNATLEGKGARTVFITNRGLKDMLSIGRQTRRELYNLQPSPRPTPVAADLCLEANCRLSATGEVIEPLQQKDLDRLRREVEALNPDAVAINLLFSFLDSSDEKRIEAAMPKGVFTSRSSFVLPEYKEYERGVATWLNAYLGPLVQRYIEHLQQRVQPSPLGIMQSSGGTIDARQAGRRAVNLLLSGPAGGLAAAKFIGRICNTEKLMTFDMGGTSTDVALIEGELRLTNEGRLGPYPVAVPMVDMHTIGAGGGSIAYLDTGGLLQVGPESAGADPGPACYGTGGGEPTVTDANVVLGRLRSDNFLGGTMILDREAAQTAVSRLASPLGLSLEQAAQGIIDIANEHMIRALRVISVQRGHDPKDFQLCCFGGAGGLHVCALAQALQMNRALVPVYGGVLSALGMLVAPRERQLSRTLPGPLNEIDEKRLQQHLLEHLEQLQKEGRRQLLEEGVTAQAITLQPSLDLRYRGQSYTLNIPFTDISQARADFHKAHELRYGHRLDMPVDLINLRLRVVADAATVVLPERPAATTPIDPVSTAELYGVGTTVIYQREQLPAGCQIRGPALICEQIATTLVETNWTAEVDRQGNLRLRFETSD